MRSTGVRRGPRGIGRAGLLVAVLACLSVVGCPTALAREAMQLVATLAGTAQEFRTVSFSPNGRWIAATVPSAIKLWDARKARLLRVFNVPKRKWVGGLAFAPSSDRLASIIDDRSVAIWRVRTGERLVSLETESIDLISIAFSRDGARIFTAGRSGLVEVWDVKSGTRLRTMSCPDFDFGHQLAINVTRDEIVSVGDVICTWNESTGKILTVQNAVGQGVAISPDGNWVGVLMLMSPNPSFLVNIWNRRANKNFGRLMLVDMPALGFSSDGKRLCTGGDRLVLWNLSTPHLVSLFELRSGPRIQHLFTACAFSANRRRMVAADEARRRLTIWKID